MTKTELVSAVASSAEMTKVDADKAVTAVLESIRDALVKGEKVSFTGFGTFEVRRREERKGRNPATGAELVIPAKNTVAFKAGKTLKEDVNK